MICCIWTIQTVMWCILFSQSVTSGWIGWSYCDWIHKLLYDSGIYVKVNARHPESSDWRLLSHVFPAWYSSMIWTFCSSIFFSMYLIQMPTATFVYVSHCLSICSLFSPSSLSAFSHYPCPFLCQIIAPHCVSNTPPFRLVSVLA